MPVQRLANILAFERRCIRSSGVVPHMPIVEHGIGCPGYPRERISPGSGAQVRRTLPVRLHLRALLARRIDALDASGYLRDATPTGGDVTVDFVSAQTTSSPMLRAVPSTVLMAAARSLTSRSIILSFAIS